MSKKKEIKLKPEQQFPFQAYFTIELLSELQQNLFLSSPYFKEMKFQDEFVKRHLPDIGIGNLGFLVMALYGILVLPWERTRRPYREKYECVNRFLTCVVRDSFSSYRDDNERIHFAYHLRNALAHARIEFIDEEYFKFSDVRGNEKFSAQLSMKDAGILLRMLMKIQYEDFKSQNTNTPP